MKKEDLPAQIPIFPLSNFIIFPKATVPLNIFEPRYIDMINDSMKSSKTIGMIQPKTSASGNKSPYLHEVGCLGKITSFKETEDGRYLIELKGLIRFENIKELTTEKKYRILSVNYENFIQDLKNEKEEVKFSDQTFKVAVIVPLTGRNQRIGHEIMMGVENAYFSDFNRNITTDHTDYGYHHIGIYGFTNKALIKYVNLKRSKLELERNLEQMRALENNMKIHVGYTESSPLSVDTEKDLIEIRKIMDKNEKK